MSSQFFLKTSKDIEIFDGYPKFVELTEMDVTDPVISSVLSPCGRFLALSTKDYVKVTTGERFDNLLFKVSLTDVYSVEFSPSGNFLSTWERPFAQLQDHQNVKVWYLNKKFDSEATNSPVYQYQHKSQSGWSLQFSKLDDYVIKRFPKELRILKLDSLSSRDGADYKFDFESPFATLSTSSDSSPKASESQKRHFTTFLISPADHPTICTFTPEKSGKPAQLTIWPIVEGKITKKIASKTFFKADSCQLKWNDQGNAVLCLAITDFDSQNKSYYGENTLYLLSFQGVNGTLGSNSARVSLTSGPVHDFTWSPTSRQFGVIAGYMPATVAFFDMKGNVVYSMPEQSKNTLLFSPGGNYILLGGFGNLQGAVEILDRHNRFKSISKFNAANTSVCKWSPGGEFIMTATTSPRLRVDNAVKIWHVSGTLVFIKEFKELLKADWRSQCRYKLSKNDAEHHIIKNWVSKTASGDDNGIVELDPKLTRAQLKVHDSVREYETKHSKGVNGGSGAGSGNGRGSSGTARGHSGSGGGGAYKPPHARRLGGSGDGSGGRVVPGMAPRPSSSNSTRSTSSEGRSSRRKRGGASTSLPGIAPPSKGAGSNAKAGTNSGMDANTGVRNDNGSASPEGQASNTGRPPMPPEEKRIRALLKKLRSIETLKQRQINGDKLEDTQILKINTEPNIRKELSELGWKEKEE